MLDSSKNPHVCKVDVDKESKVKNIVVGLWSSVFVEDMFPEEGYGIVTYDLCEPEDDTIQVDIERTSY